MPKVYLILITKLLCVDMFPMEHIDQAFQYSKCPFCNSIPAMQRRLLISILQFLQICEIIALYLLATASSSITTTVWSPEEATEKNVSSD